MVPYISYTTNLYMFSVNSMNTHLFYPKFSFPFSNHFSRSSNNGRTHADQPKLTAGFFLQHILFTSGELAAASCNQISFISTMLIHSSIDPSLCVHGRPRKQRQKSYLFGHSDPHRVSPVVNSSRQVGS